MNHAVASGHGLDPTRARRRGLSLIEAAIALPLILLILLGTIEYGWMFWKNQQINGAARQGARVGIVEGAVNEDVTQAVDQLMAAAALESSGYQITISPPDVFLADPGQPITVTVTVPYANIGLTAAPILPVPDDLAGATTMAKEGPH